ncbi:cysteine protease StiP domain-containing protein [Halopseudomonas pelagia]|nr:cysteine protease StiP domain-containing protein [Halopseudomonas pelagia]
MMETVGSGSYDATDVHFLLRKVDIEPTDVMEKERLIQSRRRHYSEMISQEKAPSDVHKQLYASAMLQNSRRMATDVQALALALDREYNGPSVALVSFVRAGIPLGVLLRRALADLGREAHHYGISIIRDRGIDKIALEAVIEAHGAENIVFVDGWTGKGAISGEVKRSLQGDARFPEQPRLVVLADPCGKAWLSASADDWVIPSGILGATVSGLVSRSIWPTNGGLHGCIVYEHLREHDVTRAFVDKINNLRINVCGIEAATPWSESQRGVLQEAAFGVIHQIAKKLSISDLNHLKPGIAEATRAVLRRVPEHVLVRDKSDNDVQLLMHLAEQAGVQVEEGGASLGPYRAVTVIRSVS